MGMAQLQDARFGFCSIRNKSDTNPQFHAGSFDDLAKYLDSHVHLIARTASEFRKLPKAERDRLKDGPAIILAEYDTPGTRQLEDIKCVHGIGLDVDEEHVELDELIAGLQGTRCIIYESANSTPDARRWRVLIPFAAPASIEEHGRAYDDLCARIPGVSNVKDAGRLWFGVTQFKDGGKRIFRVLEGSPYGKAPKRKHRGIDAFRRNVSISADEPASAGDRNNQLSRFALAHLKDCASEDELIGLCLEQNDSYDPPLPEKEVRQVARAKWKKRAKFDWKPPTRLASDRPDYDPMQHAGEDGPDEAIPADDEPGITGDELFDHDPGEVPWIVQDLVTYGAHLLVGRPKGGKSWVTMDLALSVGNGGAFLGFQCRRAGVLWIAAEDTKDSLARRLKVRGERPGPNVRIITSEGLKAERLKWDDCSFDAWLRAYLEQHEEIALVIMDTHKTCEAIWSSEAIDQRRYASIVDVAYQMIRLYEDVGLDTKTAIMPVHHAGKMKNNRDVDYHERINMPATAVAGAAGSFVLADPPDKDLHDEDDHRRVFAMRGRNIIREIPLLVELKDGRIKNLGEYREVVQSEAQAEVFAMVEALLENAETTSIKEVATAMGKHVNTVQGALSRASKLPGGLKWKGRMLSIQPGRHGGIRWKTP